LETTLEKPKTIYERLTPKECLRQHGHTMKGSIAVFFLRGLAVMFSASLLGSYVWFSQRKAQPVAVTPVEEFEGFINYGTPIEATAPDASGEPRTIILGTKNINQPIFSTRKVQEAVEGLKSAPGAPPGSVDPFAPAAPSPEAPPTTPWMMSGSKSFGGATTIVAGQLELPSIVLTPSQVVEARTKAMMPGSKRSSGVITPDSIDDLLAGLEPPSASPAVMPGSKISRVFLAAAAQSKKPATPEKPKLMMPGSKSYPVALSLPSSTIAVADGKPLQFRGTVGKMAAAPDGSLVISRPEEATLPPRHAHPPVTHSGMLRMMSGSKSASVVAAPFSPWGFDITWNWDGALHDIEAQIDSGFGLNLPQDQQQPGMISSSKWRPILPATRNKLPSVLALPVSEASAPKP
jgi:hypothetical protein